MKQFIKPLLLVLFTLILGLGSAALLAHLASLQQVSDILIITGILAVLTINGIRLIIWSFLHSRYPLSHTYPITALFFPMILGLALYRGEVISNNQIIGVLIITWGVYQLSKADISPQNQ